MPRKLLQRYFPHPDAVRSRPELRHLGSLLEHPGLFHFNRRSVAGAAAVGLFVAFIPIPGTMVVAAILAVLLRVNLVVSIAMVWITNPVTIPPIFYFCYRLGAYLMARPLPGSAFQPSWSWFWERLEIIWAPFLLGCLTMGIVSALVGYLLVQLLWRMRVARALQQRRLRRRSTRVD